MKTTHKGWTDRQENAFWVYYEMGETRTLEATCEHCQKRWGRGYSLRSLKGWSADLNWKQAIEVEEIRRQSLEVMDDRLRRKIEDWNYFQQRLELSQKRNLAIEKKNLKILTAVQDVEIPAPRDLKEWLEFVAALDKHDISLHQIFGKPEDVEARQAVQKLADMEKEDGKFKDSVDMGLFFEKHGFEPSKTSLLKIRSELSDQQQSDEPPQGHLDNEDLKDLPKDMLEKML